MPDRITRLLRRLPLIRRFVHQTGPASPAVNPRLFLLATLPRNSVGAEIGVHQGDFAALMLDIVQPSHLHLIDPWKFETGPEYQRAKFGGRATGGQAEMDQRYAKVCARFQAETHAGQVIVHRGFSHQVMAAFPDAFFDWVYIDGNHLYEFAKQDIELAFRKTKPGGFITGDDYNDGGWWQGGVKRAVDEFVQTHQVRLVTVRSDQFVIQRDEAAQRKPT
jgi:hypothetical protein